MIPPTIHDSFWVCSTEVPIIGTTLLSGLGNKNWIIAAPWRVRSGMHDFFLTPERVSNANGREIRKQIIWVLVGYHSLHLIAETPPRLTG